MGHPCQKVMIMTNDQIVLICHICSNCNINLINKNQLQYKPWQRELCCCVNWTAWLHSS